MNSKRRLIISLVTLLAVVLFGIVISLTWFVYLRYAVFTNIRGQYKANCVLGEVNANIFFAGEIYNMTLDGDPASAKKLVFDGNEKNMTRHLCVPGDRVFALTDRFSFIVLEYVFSNKSPSDEWLISLNTEFVTKQNVTVTSAYYENNGITDYSLIDNEYNNEFVNMLPVPTNGTVFVYVKIQRTDSNYNADFEADMTWTLNSRSYLNNNT